MNDVRILAECRFPTSSSQRYRSACQDENFWNTLVASRYPDFLRKPSNLSWYQWYSHLVLNGDVLIGLQTTGLPNLYTFPPQTTLKESLNYIVDQNRFHDVSLDVVLPSGQTIAVDVENGRYITRANLNRPLDQYQGVVDPSLDIFYIGRA